jgi:hypothetical protein
MPGKILYTNVSDKFCPIVGIKVKPEFGRSCRFFRNVGENFKSEMQFLNCVINYAISLLGLHGEHGALGGGACNSVCNFAILSF